MTEDIVRLIGSIEMILCVILANAFCIIYHIVARWWKSEVGRHIMLFSAVLAVVLDLWLVVLIFGPDNDVFRVLRLAAFSGIPYVLGRQIWILLKAQREGEQKGIQIHRNEKIDNEAINDEPA